MRYVLGCLAQCELRCRELTDFVLHFGSRTLSPWANRCIPEWKGAIHLSLHLHLRALAHPLVNSEGEICPKEWVCEAEAPTLVEEERYLYALRPHSLQMCRRVRGTKINIKTLTEAHLLWTV